MPQIGTFGAPARTLVIDSATEACSAALFEDGRLIAGNWQMLGRGHAERLVPMICELPENGRADRIVVALGPGSFTGVRVGLAAARALAMAWGSQLFGYSTLDLVAAMATARKGAVPLTVAMTGGHGEWFVAGYGADGDAVLPLASLTPDSAAQSCSALLAAGSQAEALIAAKGAGEALPIWPDAREFLHLPFAALRADVQPLYGRVPDAKKQQVPSRTAGLG